MGRKSLTSNTRVRSLFRSKIHDVYKKLLGEYLEMQIPVEEARYYARLASEEVGRLYKSVFSAGSGPASP